MSRNETREKKPDPDGAQDASLTRPAEPAPEDPFDDPDLERLLLESVEAGVEPKLLIVDRLLTRIRIRREV